MKEQIVHQQVCSYLKMQYPKVVFRSDYGAGLYMTKGQAIKQRAIQHGPGWPDIFIAKTTPQYTGLFIELKADGVKVYKKDGTLRKDKHLQEQKSVHDQLIFEGYRAEFCSGFEEAKKVIDWYLTEPI